VDVLDGESDHRRSSDGAARLSSRASTAIDAILHALDLVFEAGDLLGEPDHLGCAKEAHGGQSRFDLAARPPSSPARRH